MSSSSILSQIRICEGQISNLQYEILQLEKKIENQEIVLGMFMRLQSDLYDELADKTSRINVMREYVAEGVVAKRFDDSMQKEFFSGNDTNATEKTCQMVQDMRREIQHNYDTLQAMQLDLVKLESTLSALHCSYQAALAQEEAERRAAASAASAASRR